MDQQESHPVAVEMKNGSCILEDSLAFPIGVNIFLSYDLKIILLDVYPENLKTYVHKRTCTWMFIAALFTIANLEVTKHPSMDE